MRAPIRVRMTVWYVALLAVIIAGLATFLILRLKSDLIGASDRELRPALGQIAYGYRVEGVAEFRDKSSSVLTGERPASQILSASGEVVAFSGYRLARRPMLAPNTQALVLGGQRLLRTQRIGSGPAYRVAALRVERGGQRQIVVAAVSLGPVDRSVNRVLALFALALPVALAATAAGGWWLARRAMRPIDRMVRTAEAIGPADLATRLSVPATRDEVTYLAHALNTMLDRVHRSVADQKRLVADTSHELRTPLTVIRTEIDVALRTDDLPRPMRELLESNREEVDRMIATLEDLLILAHADEHRLNLTRTRVDLRALVHRLAERLGPLARGRDVTLVTEGPEVAVWADEQRLEHALRNLVDNAVKFGPRGGTVVLRTWRSTAQAGVMVEDNGPGVPPDVREHIFDRFYRADDSRDRATGGSGLGLAIVRELLLAQGGEVEVADRVPRGSVFVITLPLIPASSC